MKIGILSDTHDDIDNTNKAIDIFQENDVKAVIHAGDIISPPVITEFYRLTEKGVKLFGIFGNNDGEKRGLKNAFEIVGGKLLGDVGKIELDGLKFCIYHGQDLKKKEKIIKSGKFDVFVFGHTHTRYPKDVDAKIINDTIVLNPGTAHSVARTFSSDTKYFGESSIVIFDTTTKQYKFFDLVQ